ncbi:hypothetical protein, partial [Pyrobaculum aerophilum]|uniref:hypothetical protein n=1 Tax=Pyrobaculum aerophilum TaxID=13773 RepID=UPI0015F2772E
MNLLISSKIDVAECGIILAGGYEVGLRLLERWRQEHKKKASILWDWKADISIAPGLLYALTG